METSEMTSAFGSAPFAEASAQLAGLRGRLKIDAGGKTVGVLQVDDGRVQLSPDTESPEAAIICSAEDDVAKIVRGELNPVVAALQGRLAIHGDRIFAIKVVLGLAAAAVAKNAASSTSSTKKGA
jgi:putative sterol carrier protein